MHDICYTSSLIGLCCYFLIQNKAKKANTKDRLCMSFCCVSVIHHRFEFQVKSLSPPQCYVLIHSIFSLPQFLSIRSLVAATNHCYKILPDIPVKCSVSLKIHNGTQVIALNENIISIVCQLNLYSQTNDKNSSKTNTVKRPTNQNN